MTGATGDNCRIGSGGFTGMSEPLVAVGIAGPFAESSIEPAATWTDRGAASVARVVLSDSGPLAAGAAGKRFEVLAPIAWAAGTGLPPGSGAGGAMPPTGVMPPLGWLLNCGVLPVGAARADGSPTGFVPVVGVFRVHAVELAGAAAPVAAVGVVPLTLLNGAGFVRWKFELAPEPAQPVNEPAARTNPTHAPTVRIFMAVPFAAQAPRCGRPERDPSHPGYPRGGSAAAAAGSSLSATGCNPSAGLMSSSSAKRPGENFGSPEDGIQHRGSHAAGEGVLLAWMVTAQQRVGANDRFHAVPETGRTAELA